MSVTLHWALCFAGWSGGGSTLQWGSRGVILRMFPARLDEGIIVIVAYPPFPQTPVPDVFTHWHWQARFHKVVGHFLVWVVLLGVSCQDGWQPQNQHTKWVACFLLLYHVLHLSKHGEVESLHCIAHQSVAHQEQVTWVEYYRSGKKSPGTCYAPFPSTSCRTTLHHLTWSGLLPLARPAPSCEPEWLSLPEWDCTSHRCNRCTISSVLGEASALYHHSFLSHPPPIAIGSSCLLILTLLLPDLLLQVGHVVEQ